MDLGDDSALDFLLDQDAGSVTLCDSSPLPVCNLAPYKGMPNFGGSETGLSQPLLFVVGDSIDFQEVEASRVNSPPPPAPVPAPSGQQGATLPPGVPSTSASAGALTR